MESSRQKKTGSNTSEGIAEHNKIFNTSCAKISPKKPLSHFRTLQLWFQDELFWYFATVVSRQTFLVFMKIICTKSGQVKKLVSKYVDKSLVNSATLGTMLTPEGRAIDGTCIVLAMYLCLNLHCTCIVCTLLTPKQSTAWHPRSTSAICKKIQNVQPVPLPQKHM